MLKRNIPCFKCGCTDTDSITKDTINYMASEVEIVCRNCRHPVNYWAYGTLMEPETFSELLRCKRYPVWLRFQIFIKGVYCLIKFRNS